MDTDSELTVKQKTLPMRRDNLYHIEQNGEKLQLHSVTHILSKAIPKPALVRWAAKEAATYALANPGSNIEECINAIYKKKDDTADAGKLVHSWAEDFNNGIEVDPETLPASLRGFYTAFLAFMEKEGVEVIYTEATVFNKTVGYAGTADLIAKTRDGRTCIFDYKTGKGTYYESHLQQEAYANAEYLLTKEKEIMPMPKIDDKYLVHLKANGKFNMIMVDEPFDDFKTIVESFKVLNKQDSYF